MPKNKKMTFRDYAKNRGIEVVGKLKRVPDRHYGAQDSHYPLWVDEAGNEYMGNEKTGFCIVTKDGSIY